jgi:S-adenosylmethionine synthetase
MFGYACNEAPASCRADHYSHRLVEQQAKVRKKGKLKWLRPDAKSQVTLRYEDGNTVSASTRGAVHPARSGHQAEGPASRPCASEILKPVLPKKWLDKLPKNKVHINPTGKFVIGGPVGDCGLTGRKIIVDTYGGMARHGGGAFSGKDPSKVDRSAAYAARYVAKNIVAAGLADRCEVQVSLRDRRGRADLDLGHHLRHRQGRRRRHREADPQHFDLRPYGIIEMLDLEHPIYQPPPPTATSAALLVQLLRPARLLDALAPSRSGAVRGGAGAAASRAWRAGDQLRRRTADRFAQGVEGLPRSAGRRGRATDPGRLHPRRRHRA